MNEAIHLDQARRWADFLTKTESRGPGDMPNAWQRLERRYGIPASVFWNLRYRKPRGILTGLYTALKAAHDQECERQLRRYQHELQIATQLGASKAVVPETVAVVADPKAPF